MKLRKVEICPELVLIQSLICCMGEKRISVMTKTIHRFKNRSAENVSEKKDQSIQSLTCRMKDEQILLMTKMVHWFEPWPVTWKRIPFESWLKRFTDFNTDLWEWISVMTEMIRWFDHCLAEWKRSQSLPCPKWFAETELMNEGENRESSLGGSDSRFRRWTVRERSKSQSQLTRWFKHCHAKWEGIKSQARLKSLLWLEWFTDSNPDLLNERGMNH